MRNEIELMRNAVVEDRKVLEEIVESYNAYPEQAKIIDDFTAGVEVDMSELNNALKYIYEMYDAEYYCREDVEGGKDDGLMLPYIKNGKVEYISDDIYMELEEEKEYAEREREYYLERDAADRAYELREYYRDCCG